MSEEREFLMRSLADLDAELAAGDIAARDHAVLTRRYSSRAAALDRESGPDPVAAATRPPRSRMRRLVWAVTVVGFAGVSGVLVAQRSGQRLPGATPTGAVTPTGPSADLARAQAALSAGRYLDAVKIFDAVVRDDPRNPEALAYRGWVLRITGKAANDLSLIDRGLASVRAAESADPSYPDAHFFAGEILLRDKNDGAGAVVEFRRFLASDPPPDVAATAQGELQAALASAPPAGPP